MADVVNRTRLGEEQEELTGALRRTRDQLAAQKERLAALALQWDDLEQKSRGFAAVVGGCQHRLAEVDATFRSLPQMRDIKMQLKVGLFSLFFLVSYFLSIFQYTIP